MGMGMGACYWASNEDKNKKSSLASTIVAWIIFMPISIIFTILTYYVSLWLFVPIMIIWGMLVINTLRIAYNWIFGTNYGNESKRYDPYEDDETGILTTWQDYECEVRDEFIEYGMSARTTNGSADGGIDVIVEHNGLTIGVQVKDWQNKVGIKAVGEVLMGMGSYNCDYGCVVARSGYTQPCHSSAIDNKIALLDMEDISGYVEKIKRGKL